MPGDDGRNPAEAGELPAGRWARWWLRADSRPLLLAAALLMLGYCWEYSSPAVAMVALNYAGDLCLGPFLFVCLAAARRVQLFAARSYEAKLRVPPGKYRSRGRFGWWLVGIAGLTLGAVWSGLPMHAAFCLSRPGLDALADEALADPANAHRLAGRRAGVYRVQGVEVIGRTVVLCVDRAEGTYGFARVPGAASDYISNVNNGYPSESPHHHGDFPEYRYPRDLVGERMAGDWFVVFSGYWRIKLGWS